MLTICKVPNYSWDTNIFAMMPVNAEGDSEGCTSKDVKFSVPKSFHPRPSLLKIRVRERMFIIKEQMPCKWLPHPVSGID